MVACSTMEQLIGGSNPGKSNTLFVTLLILISEKIETVSSEDVSARSVLPKNI